MQSLYKKTQLKKKKKLTWKIELGCWIEPEPSPGGQQRLGHRRHRPRTRIPIPGRPVSGALAHLAPTRTEQVPVPGQALRRIGRRRITRRRTITTKERDSAEGPNFSVGVRRRRSRHRHHFSMQEQRAAVRLESRHRRWELADERGRRLLVLERMRDGSDFKEWLRAGVSSPGAFSIKWVVAHPNAGPPVSYLGGMLIAFAFYGCGELW